ncbi:unnamed protein product [Schistosoma turkestanicum]|nr:unnamed protein product [Schistosoma turkestanicum]
MSSSKLQMRHSRSILLVILLKYLIGTIQSNGLATFDQMKYMKDVISRSNYEKIQLVNDTYRKPFHYYYNQIVCTNCPPPVTLNTFLKHKSSKSSKLMNIEQVLEFEQLDVSKRLLFYPEYYGSIQDGVSVSTDGMNSNMFF